MPHSALTECLVQFLIKAPSSRLLLSEPGRQQWELKQLVSWHPHGRLPLSSQLSAHRQFSTGHWKHCEYTNGWDHWSCSLFSPSHSVFSLIQALALSLLNKIIWKSTWVLLILCKTHTYTQMLIFLVSQRHGFEIISI